MDSIRSVGEVHDYTFQAQAGEEYRVFIRALSDNTQEWVEVSGVENVSSLASVRSYGGDVELLDESYGFAVVQTGPVKLQVWGSDEAGQPGGAYELKVELVP